MQYRGIPIILALIVALSAAVPVAPARAQTDQQCFPETQQCLGGRFRAYWQQSGGLAVFGFPISEAEHLPSRETGQTF